MMATKRAREMSFCWFKILFIVHFGVFYTSNEGSMFLSMCLWNILAPVYYTSMYIIVRTSSDCVLRCLHIYIYIGPRILLSQSCVCNMLLTCTISISSWVHVKVGCSAKQLFTRLSTSYRQLLTTSTHKFKYWAY